MNEEARKYLQEIGARGGAGCSPAKLRALKRNARRPRPGGRGPRKKKLESAASV